MPATLVSDVAPFDDRHALALQRLAGNAAVAAWVVAQRAKTKKKGPVGVKKSKFDDLTRMQSEICALCKVKKGRKHVYYVGQTVQGAAKRHKQHAAKFAKRGKMIIVSLKKGNWTALETATWEQRYVNEYAGGGGFLDNIVYAITQPKFKKYLAAGRTGICPQLERHSLWPARV